MELRSRNGSQPPLIRPSQQDVMPPHSFPLNQQNIILPYAALADFLRTKLDTDEIVAPSDMRIVGVEMDGERVFIQCQSASWPARRGFRGRIPVFLRSST